MDGPGSSSHWLWLSLGVVGFLSANTLLLTKLRETGIKPDLLAFYWFLFVAGGLLLAVLLRGGSALPPAEFLPSQRWWPLAVFASAAIAGTIANLCFFRAIFVVSNPGYVTAIRSCEAAVVAVAAFLLSGLYAQRHDLGAIQFTGILLIVVGVGLLSYHHV
jgi:hypothetical protein